MTNPTTPRLPRTVSAALAMFWALVIAVVTQGCALTGLQLLPASGGVVCLDSRLSDDRIEAALTAIDMWRTASHERIFLIPVITSDPSADGCDADLRAGNPENDAAAMTYTKTLVTPRIRVDFDQMAGREQHWAGVIAHELGHAMGAYNSDNHPSVGIMASKVDHGGGGITAADVAAVLEAQ